MRRANASSINPARRALPPVCVILGHLACGLLGCCGQTVLACKAGTAPPASWAHRVPSLSSPLSLSGPLRVLSCPSPWSPHPELQLSHLTPCDHGPEASLPGRVAPRLQRHLHRHRGQSSRRAGSCTPGGRRGAVACMRRPQHKGGVLLTRLRSLGWGLTCNLYPKPDHNQDQNQDPTNTPGSAAG